MSALNPKLVFLNTGEKNVYASIKTFVERKAQSSTNTAQTYLRHFRDFFQTMRGKNLEQLTEEDLIFTKQEIEQYQVTLRKKYKASTVNNTISALKSLYIKLKDYGFNVDPDWFSLERYKEVDSDPYDVLSHDEIIRIVEIVRGTRSGLQKSLFVRVAYATAYRLNALLNLKWSDLQQIDGVWTLSVIDKGSKKDIKKISNELYQDLMELRKKRQKSEKIFSLTKKTVNNMMDFIRNEMKFENRNITFHSIRKASINRVGELSGGNIKMMQRHGNHSSAKTTMDNYVKSVDLSEMVVVDVEHNVDLSVFDNLSREELLTLIKSADRGTQIKLINQLKAT